MNTKVKTKHLVDRQELHGREDERGRGGAFTHLRKNNNIPVAFMKTLLVDCH